MDGATVRATLHRCADMLADALEAQAEVREGKKRGARSRSRAKVPMSLEIPKIPLPTITWRKTA